MDNMTRVLRGSKQSGFQLLRLGLTLYFLVFLAWILPNHALSHEQSNLTDRVAWSPLSNLDHVAHNPDKCQICRTHGQLDAWPVYASSEITFGGRDSTSSDPIQAILLPLSGHLCPRAPPQIG